MYSRGSIGADSRSLANACKASTAPVRIGHISELHAFVTDRLPAVKLRQICQLHGVQVIETSRESAAEERTRL